MNSCIISDRNDGTDRREYASNPFFLGVLILNGLVSWRTRHFRKGFIIVDHRSKDPRLWILTLYHRCVRVRSLNRLCVCIKDHSGLFLQKQLYIKIENLIAFIT